MLRTLTVTNFKRFKNEMRIDFEPVTVLIGANNSGKSTVLQALNIFQYCIEVTRKKRNGGVALEKLTISPEEFGALPVVSPTDLWPGGKAAGSDAIKLRVDFDNGTSITFEIKLSYNRFSIQPEVEGDVAPLIEGAQVRYVPIHSGLSVREEYLLAPARADRLRELQHGLVIRNLLWELKENDKHRWKLLKEILGRLYPAATLDVSFDKEIDRFISAGYTDQSLSRELDVVVSGSGFQQVLQIFSSVLSQKKGVVLLDEPDAHLHARLQVELMRILGDLVREEKLQFVLATHSPNLIASAPPETLRAMIGGQAYPFASTPEQRDVLDDLGAFDRMEVVPLLRTKAVVFVENRNDRNLLEAFARRHWGEKKTREVWDQVSFLYTYQEPIAADVKRMARQVRDLLNSPDAKRIGGDLQPRFLVLGDRDYRPIATVAAKTRQLISEAKSADYSLQLKCHIWSRNEIENYLLDRKAIEAAAIRGLPESAQKAARKVVRTAFDAALSEERQKVQARVADQLQKEERFRLNVSASLKRAEEQLESEWGNGTALADAKRVLSSIRKELQVQNTRARFSEAEVIQEMAEIPEEVKKVLNKVANLARPSRRRGRAAQATRASEA